MTFDTSWGRPDWPGIDKHYTYKHFYGLLFSLSFSASNCRTLAKETEGADRPTKAHQSGYNKGRKRQARRNSLCCSFSCPSRPFLIRERPLVGRSSGKSKRTFQKRRSSKQVNDKQNTKPTIHGVLFPVASAHAYECDFQQTGVSLN